MAVLSPAGQLTYILVGQAMEYLAGARQSQENPDMTQEEADALKAATKAKAEQTVANLEAALAEREAKQE